MKKTYKWLLIVICLEIVVTFVIASLGIKNDIFIVRAITTAIFFIPILILFYLLGKDSNISSKKQLLFKILFWLIILLNVVGAIGMLLE